MMRWVDPSLVLAACGSTAATCRPSGAGTMRCSSTPSSSSNIISLHTYLNNYKGDTAASSLRRT